MNRLIQKFENQGWEIIEYDIYKEDGYSITFSYRKEVKSSDNVWYCDINYESSVKSLNLFGGYYTISKSISKEELKAFSDYMETILGVVINTTNTDDYASSMLSTKFKA